MWRISPFLKKQQTPKARDATTSILVQQRKATMCTFCLPLTPSVTPVSRLTSAQLARLLLLREPQAAPRRSVQVSLFHLKCEKNPTQGFGVFNVQLLGCHAENLTKYAPAATT